jgi:predicted MFS family arabinose efflux permease
MAVPEFRRLWIADVQSLLGDQVARVALSVLVFDRTKSGLATAAIYALTFLPALLGGVLLGGLADRLPRRRVMVATDVGRAVLVMLMAVPAVPIAAIAVLLVFSVLIGSAFKSAESALVADILSGDVYAAGVGLRNVTSQVAQLIGFAGGGAAVAVLGPRVSLAVDAVSFAASALLIQTGVAARPAPPGAADRADHHMLASLRVVLGQPTLRQLLGFSWLAGCFVIPEGLAAPFAADHGGGALSLGLLLAANPAGAGLGTVLFIRALSPARRRTLLGPSAIATSVPLVLFAFDPAIPVALALLFVSGLFTAYQVQVIAEFVPAIPDNLRGQAIGVASSGLLAVQGLGLLLGGLLVETMSSANAIALGGWAGVSLALVFTALRIRVERPAPEGRHRDVAARRTQ